MGGEEEIIFFPSKLHFLNYYFKLNDLKNVDYSLVMHMVESEMPYENNYGSAFENRTEDS